MCMLTLVSNRLPVRIKENGEAERTTGGLASALAGADLDGDYTWIGWSGGSKEDISDLKNYESTLQKVGVSPVLLSQEDIDGYYEGYANSTLWPLLHYMTGRARFNTDWMPVYRRVNQTFAETIAKHSSKNGQVWIHDYHLFLLPKMLRKLRPDLKIGFFLHTPFPSSEIFRALPERDEILSGLLGCDLIGFHTFGYLRHFRSSLLRILGLEGDAESLWQGNREVRFGVYPIGHNRAGFHTAMKSKQYEEALDLHNQHLNGGKLILSVERLDYTKGVPQKLAAIRHYLKNNPEMRSKVNFVIIAVPSRKGVHEYDVLTEKVQREVGAINGEFGEVGHSPIQFLHRGFPMEELAALYALADVCLVTPIVDGMNLVAKEYIDCKRAKYGARPGALILSEFAGAAQEMSHAVLVNPHNTVGVAEAMEHALAMSDDEMCSRVRAMQDRLERNDAGAWAKRFLGDLATDPREETNGIAAANLKGVRMDILEHINAGKKAAIFMDYDGTLREFTDRPQDAIPDEALCSLLDQLGNHPNLEIAIISGRPLEFLEQHLGHLNVSLVAEHGYRWKLVDQGEWQMVDSRVDTSWKEVVLPHLEAAVTLTPGSEIENKKSSIVWHYRQADPEFGLWRAKGLLSELTSITASLPVSVHHGQKIVEIASQFVNKGAAVDHLLEHWKPEVALACGDDQTDETMFSLHPKEIDHFHTIKVGTGATRAEHRTDIKGLRKLLENLSKSL
ncbi:trehalose 6-phosphate synthase/phosphatase [Rubritalea squalenifaciens DSM 18772]|uniref:Trehalose 6-phosphate synthase/phosphatase n=2 Tax=Rubritalea TaxID=361050 RepID=A0A1M6IV35_9BACT|nr:bifunctional alpha,alpha-trehalose-phosphate synthase (UDP-forming)/trehalose-phosphatase [Rubritalea squalenifaciens]SHJ38316.1 trehalose 6-phosphate synthase/phosphatase [Rubritalea squalenifaciens DSM 18772]